MVSLKQIAEDLGISYTMVAKVLNGNLGTTGVSAHNRKAILKRARELNYRANPVAVALKSGRRGAVGIFLHHIGTPGSEISERLVRGFAQGLAESDLRMWLRFFTTNEEFHRVCNDQLRREVDGLVVGGCGHPPILSKLAEIDAGGLPVVSVFFDHFATGENPNIAHSVSVNSERQGFLAADHLLAGGCRRLVHFSCMQSRADGFERAHRERGVPVCRSLILPAKDFFLETAERLTRGLLESGTEFDAIVCQSDSQAVGAIHELIRHGVDVPGKVRVTGVDNSPLAEVCIVPVTSVTSGVRQTGLKAAQMLLDRIAGVETTSLTIEPELIVRRSSQ